MNPIALLLLAFAMSTDAFAAAIGKGATRKKQIRKEENRCRLGKWRARQESNL